MKVGTPSAGGPHAEVVALSEAGIRARGGTAVVSLEPCAHVGRTPACTEGLSEAGIARVVYAVDDPDPIAAGGARILRSRGIDVEGGVLAAEAEDVNIAWLTATRLRRPFVTLKLATTLDGRISAPDGSSDGSLPERRAMTRNDFAHIMMQSWSAWAPCLLMTLI